MKLQPDNYHTDGGNKWVVGGELEFGPDAVVTNFPSGSETVTWDQVQGKPAVIAAGATQSAARTAIGAGTSSLALGTTATTAAAGNHGHNAATASTAGFMSSADKSKLDGIDAGANNYTLPNATTSERGGVLQAAAQTDSVAADAAGLVTDFNALLAKLRGAGVLAA